MKKEKSLQSNTDCALTEKEVDDMVQRKQDFLAGKTTANPWSEIKQRLLTKRRIN